ncbi:hypothetical protein D0Y65_053551 [Glycine soja]|uniref:Uncharacterized protein n=1 Tax=Glycine soja TaxID=3848 RepID=A0A445F2C2_GLYSO|nr:hypothetical protein D0Y65_053551 [Glycine soja]RZB42989.1 hypothetical protein D0Y65_053551 [Glycine soja]
MSVLLQVTMAVLIPLQLDLPNLVTIRTQLPCFVRLESLKGSQNLVLPLRVSSPMASYTAPTSHAEKLDDIMQKLTQFQTTNPTKMDSCARVIALESCSSSSSHTATPSSSPLAFSTDVVIKSLHLTQPLLLPLPLFNRNH